MGETDTSNDKWRYLSWARWTGVQDSTAAWKNGGLLWVEWVCQGGRSWERSWILPRSRAGRGWVWAVPGRGQHVKLHRGMKERRSHLSTLSQLSSQHRPQKGESQGRVQQNAAPGNDLAWQGFERSSVFKDNVPEKAPSEFPGSACLAFQALLMNEVEGTLFKSVVLSSGCSLEQLEAFMININNF